MLAPLPVRALGVSSAQSCSPGQPMLLPKASSALPPVPGLSPASPQPHLAAGPCDLSLFFQPGAELTAAFHPGTEISSQIFPALFGTRCCPGSAHRGGTWQPEVSDRTCHLLSLTFASPRVLAC